MSACNLQFTAVPGPTENQSSTCILLNTLPLEVREHIWSFVFDQNVQYLNPASEKCFGGTSPPLILICRQIHQEAIKIFYATSAFEMRYSDDDVRSVRTWLSRIGPQRAEHIGVMRVEDDNWCARRLLRMSDALLGMWAERAARVGSGVSEEIGLKREAVRVETIMTTMGVMRWTETPVEDRILMEEYEQARAAGLQPLGAPAWVVKTYERDAAIQWMVRRVPLACEMRVRRSRRSRLGP